MMLSAPSFKARKRVISPERYLLTTCFALGLYVQVRTVAFVHNSFCPRATVRVSGNFRNDVDGSRKGGFMGKLPPPASSLKAIGIDGSVTEEAVDWISTFYQTAPYTAAFVTCGLKASAADLVAQTGQFSAEGIDGEEEEVLEDEDFTNNMNSLLVQAQEKEGDQNSVHMQRNVAFIVYGGLYQGMFQEFMYNHIFPFLFGTSTSALVVLNKVAFDMAVLAPFLCLPIAYLTKAVIFRYSLVEGLRHYLQDIQNEGLLTKYWLLWCPVQVATFSVVPEHFRIAFIAFVSFFWLIILSSIATQDRSATATPGCGEE